jgi:hypothetical protein
MNEQTAALVSTLAAKLGTTSEYLWSVLIRQAPVSAYITLAEYGLTAIVFALLWKFRALINKGIRELFERNSTEIFGVVVVIAVVIFGVIWMIAMTVSFESMVTALVNPEYWALDRVLHAVKSK